MATDEKLALDIHLRFFRMSVGIEEIEDIKQEIIAEIDACV